MNRATTRPEELPSTVLDALQEGIALVDHRGKILYSNPAWVECTGNLHVDPAHVMVGSNFLFGCEASPEGGESGPRDIARELRAVLAREGSGAAVEIPVESPSSRRWFVVRLSSTTVKKSTGAVISIHECQQQETESLEQQHLRKFTEVTLNTMPVGIAFMDTQGHMIGANRSIEEALGGDSAKFRDPEGLPRGSVIRQDGTPMPIEERPGYVAMKTGKPVTGIELGIPRREGGVRWLSGSAFPVFERNGTILGSVLQFTDISDRRRTERQLQIQHDLSLRLGATTDLTEGLRTCLYAAMSLVDMDAGGIYLLNKDSGALDLVIHKGISEEFAKTASRYEAGSDHVRAVMAGNPFYARYPTQGPSFTEGQAREGLRFMAVIPMTHRGEVIGCLNLGSHSLDDLSQSDRTLLETIALRASQAIARIKAEAELRGQEKRFRALIEKNTEGTFLTDLTWKFLYLSPSFFSLSGYMADEMVGGDIFENIHHEDLPAVRTLFREIVGDPGESRTISARVRHKSGAWRWQEATMTNHLEDPDIRALVVNCRDITERKEAEQRVQQSEMRYRSLVETAFDWIWEVDADLRITYSSPMVTRLLGVLPEELIGKVPLDLLPEGEAKRSVENLHDLLRHRRPSTPVESKHLHKNGEVIYLETSGIPMYDSDGHFTGYLGTSRDITARKRTQEALEYRNALLHAQQEVSISGMIVIDEHDRIAYYNRRMMEMWGISPEAIDPGDGPPVLEHALREVAEPDEFLERVRYLEAHRQEVSKDDVVLRSGRVFERYSAPLIGTSGEYFGRVWSFYDISELRRTQDALRKLNVSLESQVRERTAQVEASERALRMVLAGAPIPLALCSTDLRKTTTVNEEMQKLLTACKGASGPIGDLYALLGGRTCEILLDSLARSGEVHAFEVQLPNQAGARWYAVYVSFVAMGLAEATIVSLIDISRAKEAEQVLRSSKETLSHANTELERAIRMKDEFMATMSHELRTPLSAVINMSELMLEEITGPINERQRQYLGAVQESGQHLLNLINDILDISRIDSGTMVLDPGPVDLRSICESAFRMMQEVATKKGVRLGLEYLGDSASAYMIADGKRLKQVVVNLLGNAVKFTPPGKHVGLEVQSDPRLREVRLSVWDEGIGIAENDLPRLFKPFVQLDTRLSRSEGGTGLGLMIVAQIARLHGGHVSVESTLGTGSRFTIVLPWIQRDEHVPGEGGLPQGGAGNGILSSRKWKVLVIDDAEIVSRVVRDYLNAVGFEAFTATDGSTSLQSIRELHPDIVLMDVHMPGMDGLETARRIRAGQDHPEVPIIALTALAMPGDRERCLEAGMNDYLSKPVRLEDLAEVLRRHLERRG